MFFPSKIQLGPTFDAKTLIGVCEVGQASCSPSLSSGHVTVIDLSLKPMQRLKVFVQPKDAQYKGHTNGKAIILQQGITLNPSVGYCSLSEAVTTQQQGVQEGMT